MLRVLSSVLARTDCIYFCQAAELNTKSRDFYSTLFYKRRFVSRLFSQTNDYLPTIIPCVCSKSEPVSPLHVATSSSNIVALLNGVLCELRITSRCFWIASFRNGSSHLMTNFVCYYVMNCIHRKRCFVSPILCEFRLISRRNHSQSKVSSWTLGSFYHLAKRDIEKY